MDVDAILPTVEMAAIEGDAQFWRALDLANRDLESEGLYMTHLFPDDQVILTPDWLQRIVALGVDGFLHVRPFRPAALDLVLTKMMREDPQDLADIDFLLQREPFSSDQLRAAFVEARVPEIPEIRLAFVANQPRVLRLAHGRQGGS